LEKLLSFATARLHLSGSIEKICSYNTFDDAAQSERR
jgi:hypothetical protein